MKTALRKQARGMRRKGQSTKSIARELGVSVSSVSRWCSDITLSPSQRSRLDRKAREASLAALKPWIERSRMNKQADVLAQGRAGKEDVGAVSKRDLFMLGLGLYWGEGYKRGSQECALTNSDPLIIRVFLQWIGTCYEVGMDRITARLTINILYKDRAEQLAKSWSKETGIPLSQFAAPTFIHGYGNATRDPETYRGTLRVKVRNGTSLRRRILASIDAVRY